LSEYLPDYKGPARDTTVRHLLDHTAGIPNYMGEIPGVAEQVERANLSRKQMVELFSSQTLNFSKGERFSYTNSGYYLLGLIIESVSGTTYYEFLQENIFKPFGMTRTYNGNDAEIISDRVNGYANAKDGHINAAPWSYLVPFSAGSLESTLGDLVMYRRGVFHHPNFESVRKLVVQQNQLKDGTTNFYAQGALIISAPDGHRKISHPGSIWGFSSNHSYYPDEDITIVVLTNNQAEAPSPVSLERKMARVIFGIEQPEIKNLTLSQEEVAEYAGDYELRPFIFGSTVYGFIASEGHLYLRFGGAAIEQSPMIPLLSQGDNKFIVAIDDEWVLQFSVAEDGSKHFELNLLDGVFFGHEIGGN
jgi:CubicO group peptidase (beta-lactamase class C family)